MSNDDSEPVRKALFETENTEAPNELNTSGHFAVEKDTEEEADPDRADRDDRPRTAGRMMGAAVTVLYPDMRFIVC